MQIKVKGPSLPGNLREAGAGFRAVQRECRKTAFLARWELGSPWARAITVGNTMSVSLAISLVGTHFTERNARLLQAHLDEDIISRWQK